MNKNRVGDILSGRESAWHVRPGFNLYCKKGRGVRGLAGRERGAGLDQLAHWVGTRWKAAFLLLKSSL